jgi:hypothetical protein
MTERTTGATDAQIEAAAKLGWEAYTGYVTRIPWERAGPFKSHGHTKIAEAIAAYLVPPGHRIIGPEDITALRRMLALCVAVQDFMNAVEPWDFADDTVNVVVPWDAVDALWNVEASMTDGHDDRRLAALIGDDES